MNLLRAQVPFDSGPVECFNPQGSRRRQSAWHLSALKCSRALASGATEPGASSSEHWYHPCSGKAGLEDGFVPAQFTSSTFPRKLIEDPLFGWIWKNFLIQDINSSWIHFYGLFDVPSAANAILISDYTDGPSPLEHAARACVF